MVLSKQKQGTSTKLDYIEVWHIIKTPPEMIVLSWFIFQPKTKGKVAFTQIYKLMVYILYM